MKRLLTPIGMACLLALAGCGGDDDGALRDQIAMLEMERDDATAAQTAAAGQVAALQAEAETLKGRITTLMGRADISPDDLAALRSEAETLKGRITTLMGRADISPGDLAALRSEAETLKADVARLAGRADISSANLQALRDQVATLTRQLALRADITPFNLALLRAEVAILRADAAKMTDSADISPDDLSALRSQIEALQADVTRLTDEKTAAEAARQARLDAQADAGLWNGLARTIAAPVQAMSDADTLANLLPGGQTAFAPLSASVRRNLWVQFPSNGAAYLKTISSDGQGGFNVTWMIDGVETPIHFAANELDAFGGFEKSEDGYYSLYGWTDAFYAEDPDNVDRTDGSSQFDYLDLVGWNIWPFADGIALTGFSTFGARTMPGNLPTGSATYEGYMYAQRWEADNPDFGRGGGRYLYGDLILEADLSDMMLSGQIDGIYIPDWSSASGQNEPLEGSAMAIERTAIDDAEFMAPWVGSGPMDAARDRTLHGFEGTVVGEFYGPAAEEVGGVLSGYRDGMQGGSHELLVGGFGAKGSDQ